MIPKYINSRTKKELEEIYNKAINEWKLTSRKGEKPAISTWYHMLNNPFYSGQYEYPAQSGQWFKGKA